MVTNTYSSPWNSSTLANNPKDNKIIYSTTYNTSKVSCLKNVEMCNPGLWESTKSVSSSERNIKSGFGAYLTLTENWLSQEHYFKEKKPTIVCLIFGSLSLLTWHFIKSQIIVKIDGSKWIHHYIM